MYYMSSTRVNIKWSFYVYCKFEQYDNIPIGKKHNYVRMNSYMPI